VQYWQDWMAVLSRMLEHGAKLGNRINANIKYLNISYFHRQSTLTRCVSLEKVLYNNTYKYLQPLNFKQLLFLYQIYSY